MPQNIHVESFLEMLAVERGAAATTCESYRGKRGWDGGRTDTPNEV